MPTAWKGLSPLLEKQLAPMVQSTIGYAQVTCHLRQRFLAGSGQLHGFHFKLARIGPLLFWHDALPLEAIIQLYLLRESPSSPHHNCALWRRCFNEHTRSVTPT